MEINKIYCEDCLETMARMSDNYIDLTMTSPPFKDEDINGEYWNIYDRWFNEMLRITKNVLIIIHSATKMNYHISTYPPKRTMIWIKGIIKHSWRYNPIYVYQKRDEYNINKRIWSDTFGVSPINGKEKQHKYQDPLILYRALIKMFNDCELIYDAFAGSGTTAIAALRENKNWIASEIKQGHSRETNKARAKQAKIILTHIENYM